jgi:serine O-acetyltransferase
MTPWDAMKADTFRICGTFSWRLLLKNIIMDEPFRAVISLRLCQGVANSKGFLKLTFPFFRILHHFITHRAALGLQWSTEIGPGFALIHGNGVRMSKQVRIGRNVTLLHGVTIGQRHKIMPNGERQIQFPVIEDEVFIGPYAIIVGGVTIGEGSRIAGGAFVTQSVPPHSTVVGNPAQIIRSNCVADVMHRAPV